MSQTQFDNPNFQGNFDNPTFQGGTVSLNIATIPDYLLTWEPASVVVNRGDAAPVQWIITRADGQNVPLPTTASISIQRPDFGIDPIGYDAMSGSSNVPAASMIIGSGYTFALPGLYLVTLSVQLSTGAGPTQTRTAKVLILSL